MAGLYLFADFESGRVWVLEQTAGGYATEELIDSSSNSAAFSRGNDGEVYALGISSRRRASTRVDQQGVARLEDWITSLTECNLWERSPDRDLARV